MRWRCRGWHSCRIWHAERVQLPTSFACSDRGHGVLRPDSEVDTAPQRPHSQ